MCATEDVWVGHGQCLDQYGAGEAYLPVLEALGRLCRAPEGAPLVAILRQYAPSWLVHLPALHAFGDRERLVPLASGVTPARMLRELAEALEVLTGTRPLVLVLEDLHWSDRVTLEWLAYVVRRRDPVRLLILGTYRPVDVMVHAPALRARSREPGTTRSMPSWCRLAAPRRHRSVSAAALRSATCPRWPAPARASADGRQPAVSGRHGGRTGTPGAPGDSGGRQKEPGGSWQPLSEVIPLSLQQYIEQHFEQVSEADQALWKPPVAGSMFAVAAVAAGVAQAPETLEARYKALLRQGQFIKAAGTETWPDGIVTACYQFRHALYHEVVYARVSAGHRVRLHEQIGVRKEMGYGAQARQIATELALHFTRGHDAWRAVTYLQYAGENALRRSAYHEAVTHLTRGLEILTTPPRDSRAGPDRSWMSRRRSASP